MTDHATNPPYFDGLLARLASQDQSTTVAFGRHVHWGYWQQPSQAVGSAQDYGAAAEALCRKLCDAANIQDGMRILDVGCGFGGTIASLNERFGGLQLVGVNVDQRQLERATAIVQPLNDNTIEFVHADAASIPLPDNSFDAVIAVECVFHFDRLAFFAEAKRLLRPASSLTLSDFVPSQRAQEYLDTVDFSADESIRWSYGNIDLSFSLNRYHELAQANDLSLCQAIDITENTLPTYDFLYASAAEWDNSEQIDMFTRATRLLEKMCRKGMISYQILRFGPTDS